MSLADLRAAIEIVGFGFEALGVVVIALGTATAIARILAQGIRNLQSRYRELRHELGGTIVLGLEFLVAGDIIRTVAVDPSLQSVAALGLIVLIRHLSNYDVATRDRWLLALATTRAIANRTEGASLNTPPRPRFTAAWHA